MSIKMKYLKKLIFFIIPVMLTFTCVSVNGQEGRLVAEQWAVFETSFTSSVQYNNAFTEVAVDVIFRQGEKQWKVPAFWVGDKMWTVRFAPPTQGNLPTVSNALISPIPASTGRRRRSRLRPTRAIIRCSNTAFCALPKTIAISSTPTARLFSGWATPGGRIFVKG